MHISPSATFLLVVLAAGCALEAPDPDPAQRPLPTTSGTFRGAYAVPAPTELAAAATFVVDHYDWLVAGDAVTLHYDLPVGLVGGEVEVTLSGTLDPDATSVLLSGPAGTGTCTSDGTIVTCVEHFTGLGPLPISMAVVEATARIEYAGAPADRIAIAELFDSDPIGIATYDLRAPVLDD